MTRVARPGLDAESLGDSIARHDTVFDGFVHHMDVGNKLGIRAAFHRLPRGALFLGECSQRRHFIKTSTSDLYDDGDCFIFGQQK